MPVRDTSWDIRRTERGTVPDSEEAFERKSIEWQRREWPAWLQQHLAFPFHVVRMEDEYHASVSETVRHEPFRIGHTMVAVGIYAEEDPNNGILLQVTEGRHKGYVPLADVEVTPKEGANFWSVREYVVWFANRG